MWHAGTIWCKGWSEINLSVFINLPQRTFTQKLFHNLRSHVLQMAFHILHVHNVVDTGIDKRFYNGRISRQGNSSFTLINSLDKQLHVWKILRRSLMGPQVLVYIMRDVVFTQFLIVCSRTKIKSSQEILIRNVHRYLCVV